MAFSMDMSEFDCILKLDKSHQLTLKWLDLQVDTPYRLLNYEFIAGVASRYCDKDGNAIDACVVTLQQQDGEEIKVWGCTALKKQLREREIDFFANAYIVVSKGEQLSKLGKKYHSSILTSLPVEDFEKFFHVGVTPASKNPRTIPPRPQKKVPAYSRLGNMYFYFHVMYVCMYEWMYV